MKELFDLKIVHEKNIGPFYPRVRDREDIAVLRDEKTGVIFLDSMSHMRLSHYEEVGVGSYGYWGQKDKGGGREKYEEDDRRRSKQFGLYFKQADVIDIGCGMGGLLEEIKSIAKSVAGVEPREGDRDELARRGYRMYRRAADAPAGQFDVACLFHVFEHATEPLDMLKDARTLLRPGGTLLVEVPHARDVLMKLDAFKAFTLWSEHLVLHTKESLRRYLKAAGFKNIRIEGFQRYPLGNHVGWLVDSKPGGQSRYSFPEGAVVAYEKALKETDQTDTLIAFATK